VILNTMTSRRPIRARQPMKWWHGRAIDRWCKRTTQEVADEITDNPDLAAAFAAQWFDHGGRPSKASFAMHALITGVLPGKRRLVSQGRGRGFCRPHDLPTITKAGGAARANTGVETLLIENDRVVGVRTAQGEEIRADAVISDIGARETVNTLLPADCGHQDWIDEIEALPPSVAHFSLFVGFEGDIEAAGATRSNHWILSRAERSTSSGPTRPTAIRRPACSCPSHR
jgi:all-trans-retinol 13,14-reductase